MENALASFMYQNPTNNCETRQTFRGLSQIVSLARYNVTDSIKNSKQRLNKSKLDLDVKYSRGCYN